MSRGLTATAALWPDIERAYGWVHQAAHILANHEQHDADGVRAAYGALVIEMRQQCPTAGTLLAAMNHFLKVTGSYWPGLFHGYAVADLPRTNNDLEQFFGAVRYHERRTTGRKVASPALVVRGSARVVAAVATRRQPFGADELAPHDVERWRAFRADLEYRHEARRAQRRFRRDPDTYLSVLETHLLTSSLPA